MRKNRSLKKCFENTLVIVENRQVYQIYQMKQIYQMEKLPFFMEYKSLPRTKDVE